MKKLLRVSVWAFFLLIGHQTFADNLFEEMYKASSVGVRASHRSHANSTSSSSSSCSLTVYVNPFEPLICQGSQVLLTAVATDNSSFITSYNWTNFATTDTTTVAPTTTGFYFVTVYDGIGCSSSSFSYVIVNSTPTVTVAPETTCSGVFTTLTANVTDVSSSSFSYTWSTGGTNDTIDVDPSSNTSYSVTVTDGNNCSATASALVTVNSSPTVTVSPQTICSGTEATLTASVTDINSSTFNYTWNTGGTNDTIDVSPATSGTYTVVVEDGNNCSATATGNVTVNSTPTVTIAPQSICSGNNAILTATVADPSSSSYTYNWNTGGTNDTIDVSTPGLYTVTVTDGNHCSSTASTTVAVNSSPTVTVTPQTICSGTEATLTATVTDLSSSTFTYNWNTGGTNDTIDVSPATSGTYTVTVIDGNNCSATAIGSVIVNASPVVTVQSYTVCSGSLTTLTANVTDASSSMFTYSWSTGGTNDTIDVSTANNQSYSVTVTDGNNCTGMGVGTITIISGPTVTIAPQTICSGTEATVLANVTDFSSSTYTYNWNTGGTNDTIDVSPATSGTYTVLVTDGNNCTATASGNVTVNSTPTVTVSPQTICSGNNATLTATVTDLSSSTFTYNWNTGGTNDTIDISPATSGTYTVVVNDGNNCSATATGNVTVNSTPTVTVAPQTICSGNEATLTANITDPSSSTFTYNWNTGGTNDTIDVSSGGSYTVTVTDGNNCSATAIGNVTVNSTPTVTVSPQTICSGTEATLTATLTDINSSTFTYNWNTGGTNDTIDVSPATSGTYTVVVSDGNNCSATATGNVTVNSTPTVTVAPQSICLGNVATLTANITDLSSSTFTYNWNTGGTNDTIDVSSAGTYTVVVTDGNSCSATTTGTVSINSSPTVTIAPQTICSGTEATLTATVTDINSSTFTYNWNTGGTNDTIDVSPATSGTYTVIVTDGNSCTATATGNVTVNSSPTVTVSPQTICSGTEATLTATVTDLSSSTFTYNWNTGGTNDTIDVSPATSGTYTVVVSDGNNCSATATGNVTVNSTPTVTIAPQSICSGGQATLTATVTDPSSSTYTYNWNTGGTNDTIDVSSSGSYTVTVTDGNNCSATAIGNVTINSGPSVTVSPQTICSGTEATLTATVTDLNSSTFTYNWNTGGTNDTIDVSPATSGTYTVTVIDGNNCSATAIGSVTVNATPTVTIAPKTTCAGSGNIITLTATVTDPSSSTFTYNWSTGGTNDTIDVIPSTSTTYTVTVTDGNNCTATAIGSVAVNASPIVSITNPSPDCAGTITTLTGVVTDGSSNVFTYFWNTGGSNDTADVSPPSSTSYTLLVVDGNGCSGTDTTWVQIYPLPVVTFTTVTFGDTVCQGTTPIAISGGSPAGGIYSGTDVGGGDFTPSSTGTFRILYTYSDGHSCTDTASHVVVVKNCAGINNITASSNFEVYPNPANSNLNIKFDNSVIGKSVTLSITDVTGRVIAQSVKTIGAGLVIPVDVSILPGGMYFLKITTDATLQITKFVKQ